jgi:hypothetical protein
MNPILTLEAANLYCGKEPSDASVSNHLTLTDVKIPGLDEQYVDHRPGGAPVSIEIDTMIAKPECTFVLMGIVPQVTNMAFSWGATDNTFYIYGAVRDRQQGFIDQVRAILKGRLGRTDPQAWRRGSVLNWNFAIKGIVQYQLYLGQQELIYWDFFTNVRRIGGFDQNAEQFGNFSINSALGLSAPQATVFNPGG